MVMGRGCVHRCGSFSCLSCCRSCCRRCYSRCGRRCF